MTPEQLERAKKHLSYDPVTGEFTWKTRRAGKALAGSKAGSTDSKGYLQIKIEGKRRLAHRVAWAFVHGRWPAETIDHINCVRSDNRISNLRICSLAENQQNRTVYTTNTSGYTGVHLDKRSLQWRAKLTVSKRQVHLGRFETPEAAFAAYCEAKSRLHHFHSAPPR